MSDRPPGDGSSDEALDQLPPHVIGERVDGKLHVSPRPALRHSLAASVLTSELIGPFSRGKGGPGGWVILAEPELHLGQDVLVPDVAAWRRERMPEVPDTAATSLAPDWVCEVLSPSTTVLDRGQKMKVYAAEGVKHVWLVDPAARMLEVFRLESGRWLLLGTHVASVVVRAEPFEALDLELGALWVR